MKTIVMVILLFGGLNVMSQETLPPLTNGVVPLTVEALWAGYDPRAEPLDVEVLKEWEEDGVVLKVLRYRVGVFNGEKAMMAAVYGYPKGGTNLPALVQIHGGGQFAQYQAPLSNAKRGYATISIAWAGRLAAPDYQVDPDAVKLFWDGDTNAPRYRITTDWGAIDAYHSPCRYPKNSFVLNPPSEHSIDPVASPRNSGWFPCTMAARRALTFLEQQPEVDAERLGVYGHSMGGKLTVLTAGTDTRVKAAAPSCGGMSDDFSVHPAFSAALGDVAYLKNITCPIMFLRPANDFHGRINDLQTAIKEIKSADWRVTCSPHHNHQDNAEHEVATMLWMDQYLKGTFVFPKTPETKLLLDRTNGVPSFGVQVDASKPILQVDVFYTQHGQVDGKPVDFANTIAQFWHYAPTRQQGNLWVADLPLASIDKPLWVYANVMYALDPAVSGVGYYYRAYTTDVFVLSSRMTMITADELKTAGVKVALEPSRMIENFEGEWEKEWFRYKREEWTLMTHKLYSERWKAPEGASLQIEVLAAEPNKMVIGLDQTAGEIDLHGGPDWQVVTLSAADFQSGAGTARSDWNGIKQVRLLAKDRLTEKVDGKDQVRELGAPWIGTPPQFRNLQWVVAE